MASPTKNESSLEQNEATKVEIEQAEEAVEKLSNASKLRLMGHSVTSVLGQLTSLSLGGATSVGSPTSQDQSISNEPGEPEEFKSLLHKTLYQRNLNLYKAIRTNVHDNYTKVPQKLNDLGHNLDMTQAVFQETLMALQQANHHCSETFWTMDDTLNIANSTSLPTT